ncbi:hypothetical protein SAMN02745121_02589 [Nannocystis exedens]|uniref:DUF1554 domain-containing protein n=1 Tax=Nannocystis exedens TaxID=54 RepID=A0A1I1WX93_9BACT|nr:hypothetical protein [Nannocystis exedens]PCC70944.1 hypothetical protein NAEX_04010 [Nannocystis exedens]SFD99679.1 hypothetical protein SAMN02745121_02589 [Nannocystis exedens]
MIATSAQDLLDGELNVPIDVDENGLVVVTGTDAMPCMSSASYVWTGANFDGYNSDPDCDGWNSVEPGTQARIGDLTATGPEWSAQPTCTLSCAEELRIYCIEKAP